MSPLCLDHPATFARVYAAELPGIVRYCQARINQREDAEDVAATIWMRAYEHRGRMTVWRLVRPWLYRIAHNAVIDHYRRRRLTTVPLDDAPEIGADTWDQVDAGIVCEELLRGVSERRSAAILRAHWLGGMYTREIAAELGMTPAAVRVAELRAVRRMRAA